MKAQRNALIVLVMSAMLVVGLAATAAQAQGGQPEVKSADAFGIIWEHGNGNASGHARPQKNLNLTWHGGPVQHGPTAVYPIYWGSSWGSPGDRQAGLDSFYGSVGGTNYAKTNTEYYDGVGHVSAAVSFGGDTVDLSSAPSRAPSTTDVLNEVAHVYGSNLHAGAYYPVYIDQPRGNAGYCAWHSAGTIGGVEVQFGFFFRLDGDPGCDPQGSNGYSEGAQALVNVSGHELSEMLTDPQLNAWFDNSGAENSDKCAWTFGSSPVKIGSTSWKIQGNWSNNAYNSNTGYVRGCIDGN